MRRRWGEHWGWLVVALSLIATVAPLATGARTLFLRDVLRAHLGMRAFLAQSIRSGELPLVDPLRAGGQGLVGNPNAVALYPDNLLLLVSSTLWQLNAHFWLHWLIAFAAMAWLARQWGLSHRGSLAAAAAYGWSGFFVSQLNFYNAVAVTAWAPALAACVLACLREERPWRWAAGAGATWALMLLGGDPLLAAIGMIVALALGAAGQARIGAGLRGRWIALGSGLAAGALIASPQLVELARLIPGSYRGFHGFSAAVQGVANPRPEAAIELLLPLFFGRPDLRQVWGQAYFGGQQPLYFSLAPGVLVLALAAAGFDRRERQVRVATALALLCAALAFSGGVVGSSLGALPGGGLFRYSVKLALGAAVAVSLLAGLGLEGALASESGRRRARWAILAELVLLTILAVGLSASGSWLGSLVRRVFMRGLGDELLAGFRPGWLAVLLIEIATLVLALVALVLALRRPAIAGVTLVGLHAATQLLLLSPLIATDEAARYERGSVLLGVLEPRAVLVHGGQSDAFVRGYPGQGHFPDNRALWMARRMQEELFGFPALLAGLHAELDLSPDGLDAFPSEMSARALPGLDDARRVLLLRALGVDQLLMPRPLAMSSAELVDRREGANPLWIYRIPGALRDAELVGAVRFVPDIRSGVEAVIADGFDPRRVAVIGGEGDAREGMPGVARITRFEPECVEVDVESAGGGVLVVRRAWLSIWEVELDGQASRPRVANVSRLAVEVPAGSHHVRFFVSRRPFHFALAAAFAGVAALVAMAAMAARAAITRRRVPRA